MTGGGKVWWPMIAASGVGPVSEHDLRSFLDRCAAAGANLELQPWQVECLERWRGGEIRMLSLGEMGRGAYNARKQLMADIVTAHAIASGEVVRFIGSTRAQAEESRQRALAILDLLDAS